MQADLFSRPPSYPHAAGFREPTTSKENAARIEKSGRAKTLRDKVKAFFDAGNKATADEVALILDIPFRAAQPRLSELRAQGFIKPTGERRVGSGGGMANIWVKT